MLRPDKSGLSMTASGRSRERRSVGPLLSTVRLGQARTDVLRSRMAVLGYERSARQGGSSGCGKTRLGCHSEESRSDRDDEESRIGLKTLRARFLAEFTLSETRRSFSRVCGIRMTANGLGMTAWKGFSAACLAIGNRKDGSLGNPGIYLHDPVSSPSITSPAGQRYVHVPLA